MKFFKKKKRKKVLDPKDVTLQLILEEGQDHVATDGLVPPKPTKEKS